MDGFVCEKEKHYLMTAYAALLNQNFSTANTSTK